MINANYDENSFGALIVRHRNERKMTERDLADAIRRNVERNSAFNVDSVLSWEKYRDVPRIPEVYKALEQILILDNGQIPEDQKDSTTRLFGETYRKAREFVDKTHGANSTFDPTFGDFITDSRERLNFTARRLADEICQRLVPPTEDVMQLDIYDIAAIQGNHHVPSPGLANAIITVLSTKGHAEDKTHMLDSERAALLKAYHRLPKPAASAKEGDAESKSTIGVDSTPRIIELRGMLRLLFTGKDGFPTSDRMNEILEPHGMKFPDAYYTNFFGREKSRVYPLSENAFAHAMKSLPLVLQAIGNEKDMSSFSELASDLRSAIHEARRYAGRPQSGAPEPLRGVEHLGR